MVRGVEREEEGRREEGRKEEGRGEEGRKEEGRGGEKRGGERRGEECGVRSKACMPDRRLSNMAVHVPPNQTSTGHTCHSSSSSAGDKIPLVPRVGIGGRMCEGGCV